MHFSNAKSRDVARFAPNHMQDESGGVGDLAPKARPDFIVALADKLRAAAIEPVALDAKTVLGEQLFLRTRTGIWEMHPNKSLLLVSLFAVDGTRVHAVAHYDWDIEDTRALGNRGRPGGLDPTHPWDRIADKKWSGQALEVVDTKFIDIASNATDMFAGMRRLRDSGIVTDENQWYEPVYQKRGLSGFLTVCAAIELDRLGVTDMDLGQLSQNARKAWTRFGTVNSTATTPAAVLEHPYAEVSVKKFVQAGA